MVHEPRALADRIHELGCEAGVTINPDGPLDRFREATAHVELALVMTIFAGFGGQKFMTEQLAQMRAVKSWLRPEQRLEVDGGINPETVGLAAAAGADVIVAGTAVFRCPGGDYARAIAELRQVAAEGLSGKAG